MDVTFDRALRNDAKIISDNRSLAFYDDYVKYGTCPGYRRPYEQMKTIIEENVVFKIRIGERVVGDVSIKSLGNEKYFLGCLCIIPEFQGLGVGHKVMDFVSETFVDAKYWSLETPVDNERNVYFYRKHGFNVRSEYADGAVKVYLLEKQSTDLLNQTITVRSNENAARQD